MTTDLKERLRVGRERATAERHADEDVQVRDFRAWLQEERRAYARLTFMREEYGPEARETTDAQIDWHQTIERCPRIPPDSAFKREHNDVPIFIDTNHE